jgi:hypothetical protein
MIIRNEESHPSTHDVWLQGLKQLAFHTDKHINVLSLNYENLDDSKSGSLTSKPCTETCWLFESIHSIKEA